MKEFYFNKDEIYYRKNEFQPERLTLVFIHGVSGSSSAWFPYEKIFENKYNVLTYDIRGHGMSKKYSHYEDYEVKKFAVDLHKLISYLNIKKFVLISNSFGGLVHLEYLRLHDETVIANIFTSPEIYLEERFITKFIRSVLTLIKEILKILPFNPKPRGHIDYTKHIGSTDWNIKRNLADMRNTGLHAHFYTLQQSFNEKLEYNLGEINAPTLIMHGEKDSMVPLQNSISTSKQIKNSELVIIPNVDHNTVHNAVKLMSETMESFFKKNLLY